MPVAGTGGQALAGMPGIGMRAKDVTSRVAPARVTVTCAGRGQAFVTKAARQGGSTGG